MIENVKLTDGKQTLEIDREKTKDYVLDTVNPGDRDTSYSTIRTHDIIGLEWDIWHKRLTNIEIVGYVVADDRDTESMELRKMRLNSFVVPQTEFNALLDGENDLTGTPGQSINFIATESIRYGKTHTENNEAFCKFQVTGLYRQ